MGGQLDLFGFSRDHAATWSPRDLWLKLDRFSLAEFLEDRRLERKTAKRLHFGMLAEYLSMWSNTVEGGILLLGVEDNGRLTGCANVTQEQLNNLDKFHREFCPEAAPESKRIPIEVDGSANFVVSIFIPYRGILVETNRGEAFIRRGDSKHQMSAEERDDFRSTRHERSWEQRPSGLVYPKDFDAAIINEFCGNFREREGKEWSNEEVLFDRHLFGEIEGKAVPLNCLTLFAAKDPRSVPAWVPN